jgi:hypothetical protein
MIVGKNAEPPLIQAFIDSKFFFANYPNKFDLQVSFLFSVLITFVGHFNQIVNTLSEKLRARADNKTVVNLLNELNRATLDAIALVSS